MAKETITRVTFSVVEKLMIADPCYIDKNDTIDELARLGVTLTDCGGDWVAEVVLSDEGKWGERVSLLRATRCDARNRAFESSWEREGENGVDSGQMFIGCISDFPLDYDLLLERYKGPDGEWQNIPFFAFGEGAVSSTGYGDGCYPVYVKRDVNGRPTAVEVRFMDDEDEEEE